MEEIIYCWHVTFQGRGSKGKSSRLAKSFKAHGINAKIECWSETWHCGHTVELSSPRYTVVVSPKDTNATTQKEFDNICESIKAQTI